MVRPHVMRARRVFRSAPALAENAVMALFYFVVLAFMTRILSATNLRVFIVTQTAMVLAYFGLTAMWVQPSQVYLVQHYRTHQRAYVTLLLASIGGAAALLGVATYLAAAWLPDRATVQALALPAAVATATWAAHEQLRKVAYGVGRDGTALAASTIAVATFCAVASALAVTGTATPARGLFGMAIAFAAGALWALVSVLPRLTRGATPQISDLLRRHVRHGRSLAGGMVAYWASTRGLVLLAAPVLTAVDLGTLRVTIAFAAVLGILLAAFDSIETPRAARAMADGGPDAAWRHLLSVSRNAAPWYALATLVAFPVGLVLVPFVYGATYAPPAYLVGAVLAYHFVFGACQPLTILARVRDRPSRVFLGHFVAAVFVVTVTTAATSRYGLLGAAVTFALSAWPLFIVLTLASRTRGKADAPPSAVDPPEGLEAHA